MKIQIISTSSPMYYEPIHEFSTDLNWLSNAFVECKLYEQSSIFIDGKEYKISEIPNSHPSLKNSTVVWSADLGQEKLNFYLRYDFTRLTKINNVVIYPSLIYSETKTASKVYLHLIERYGSLCSSKIHTLKGMNYWQNLIKKAIKKSFYVYRLDREIYTEIFTPDNEWSKDREFLNTRIVITKEKI